MHMNWWIDLLEKRQQQQQQERLQQLRRLYWTETCFDFKMMLTVLDGKCFNSFANGSTLYRSQCCSPPNKQFDWLRTIHWKSLDNTVHQLFLIVIDRNMGYGHRHADNYACLSFNKVCDGSNYTYTWIAVKLRYKIFRIHFFNVLDEWRC